MQRIATNGQEQMAIIAQRLVASSSGGIEDDGEDEPDPSRAGEDAPAAERLEGGGENDKEGDNAVPSATALAPLSGKGKGKQKAKEKQSVLRTALSPTQMWMLLVVRMITRAQSQGNNKRGVSAGTSSDDDTKMEGTVASTNGNRSDELRGMLLSFVLEDFPSR
jgi:hypothetical protein